MSTLEVEQPQSIYTKIGGWLIFPAILHPLIGVALNAKGGFDAIQLYSDALPAPNRLFIIFLALASIAAILLWCGVARYAWTLDHLFPKFYIFTVAFELFSLTIALSCLYLIFNVPPEHKDVVDAAKGVLSALVWIPYMLVSRRVKATYYGIPMPMNAYKGDAHRPPQSQTLVTKPTPSTTQPALSAEVLRLKRKAHRLGIFVTVVSFLAFAAAFPSGSGYSPPAWASFMMGLGVVGFLFGYVVIRLWYWFKAA